MSNVLTTKSFLTVDPLVIAAGGRWTSAPIISLSRFAQLSVAIRAARNRYVIIDSDSAVEQVDRQCNLVKPDSFPEAGSHVSSGLITFEDGDEIIELPVFAGREDNALEPAFEAALGNEGLAGVWCNNDELLLTEGGTIGQMITQHDAARTQLDEFIKFPVGIICASSNMPVVKNRLPTAFTSLSVAGRSLNNMEILAAHLLRNIASEISLGASKPADIVSRRVSDLKKRRTRLDREILEFRRCLKEEGPNDVEKLSDAGLLDLQDAMGLVSLFANPHLLARAGRRIQNINWLLTSNAAVVNELAEDPRRLENLNDEPFRNSP